ncbi:MAG: ABC transporter permease, partial [Candidatus Ornithospirochaeta sp.]
MEKEKQSLAILDKVKAFIASFGWPRLIIAMFLLALFLVAPIGGISILTSISDVLMRFGMNSIMVLAMVPMIHSGCGLNFGLPLGIISGLLGGTLSMQFGFTGPLSFLVAILITIGFGTLFGWAYG